MKFPKECQKCGIYLIPENKSENELVCKHCTGTKIKSVVRSAYKEMFHTMFPPILYHGTSLSRWESIKKNGLIASTPSIYPNDSSPTI